MLNTIPASQIASVQPNVLSAGGTAIDLNGLMLTTNTRVPIGSVLSFPTAAAVSTYFGASSAEAAAAAIYFAGFNGSNKTPGALLFAQYPEAAVAGYLRGGNISGLSLTGLQALTGVLSLTVAGTLETSGTINLSAATSFSNAATLIQAAFTTPPFTVTYDSVSGAFVFTTNSTGASETITFASGTLSAGLLLTQATGAVTSQGAAAATPSAFMTSVVNQTQAWATFKTMFDPDNGTGNANKLLFAEWTSQQNNRYAYICWDTDTTVTTQSPASTSLGQLLKAGSYSGIALITEPSETGIASFVQGAIASIDFTQQQGRITLAFKSGSGLTASVTDPTSATNALANGYNFYGTYGTGSQEFTFFYNGQISGPYAWIDSFVNQIWMTNGLQVDLMTLFTNAKSIPYNTAGYTMIESTLAGSTIAKALNFGAIQPNVSLSALQASEVNTAAGANISNTLQTRGWYLQVLQASASARAARTTPPCTFWYMDGGSVQQINLASVEIQ
jgi:hypothetical protein